MYLEPYSLLKGKFLFISSFFFPSSFRVLVSHELWALRVKASVCFLCVWEDVNEEEEMVFFFFFSFLSLGISMLNIQEWLFLRIGGFCVPHKTHNCCWFSGSGICTLALSSLFSGLPSPGFQFLFIFQGVVWTTNKIIYIILLLIIIFILIPENRLVEFSPHPHLLLLLLPSAAVLFFRNFFNPTIIRLWVSSNVDWICAQIHTKHICSICWEKCRKIN